MTGSVHAMADHDLVSPGLHVADGHVEARTQLFPDSARRGRDADAVTGTQGTWVSNRHAPDSGTVPRPHTTDFRSGGTAG